MRKIICIFMTCFIILSECITVPVLADAVLSNGYSWHQKDTHEYVLDFNETKVSKYVTMDELEFSANTGFKVEDGKLYCKKGALFSFGGAKCLGDDYGFYPGHIELNMSFEGGYINIGVRTDLIEPSVNDDGLWFKIEEGKLTVKNTVTKENSTYDITVDQSQYHKYTIEDNVDSICFKIDDTVIATHTFDAYPTGYWFMIANKYEGFIEEMRFTHTDIGEDKSLKQRDIDYRYWVATDDLNRTTPTNKDTGDVRDRQVGVFYFICMTGAGIKVQDNTKIYLENGIEYLKDYLQSKGGEGYWSEPYFGYYKNSDTWVFRKHAYMLESAGVDFIFLDVSNANIFEPSHLALFDTWLQIRQEGGQTPQICFLTGDTPSTLEFDLKGLYKTVYSDKNYDKYKELFYMWEGKPLIFGNTEGVSAETLQKLENFTVRGCWAWCNKNGYWNWLEELNVDGSTGKEYMYEGRDLNGKFEQLAVTMGHHPSSSKGRSFVRGKQSSNGQQDFEFSLDTARYGYGFASQFEYAIKKDPSVIMITGWNEWIAGKPTGAEMTGFANTVVNGYCYVDQFNPEFSRDGEPMKIRDGVGFGDNFYYQTASYIRKYKGTEKIESAVNQKTIDISADISVWDDVGPMYCDTIYDIAYRNEPSYDITERYINNTGRNDFDYAKVSQDSKYMYFLAKTVHDIEMGDDSVCMNLLIDTDMDHTTGWEGYDYIIGRSRKDGKATLEKFDDAKWTSTKIGECEYTLNGEYMVVKVKKADMQIGSEANLYFKWTDNSTTDGNVMQFMDIGDVMPNDRYSFCYAGNAELFNAEDSSNIVIIIVSVALIVLLAGLVTTLIIFKKRQKKIDT